MLIPLSRLTKTMSTCGYQSFSGTALDQETWSDWGDFVRHALQHLALHETKLRSGDGSLAASESLWTDGSAFGFDCLDVQGQQDPLPVPTCQDSWYRLRLADFTNPDYNDPADETSSEFQWHHNFTRTYHDLVLNSDPHGASADSAPPFHSPVKGALVYRGGSKPDSRSIPTSRSKSTFDIWPFIRRRGRRSKPLIDSIRRASHARRRLEGTCTWLYSSKKFRDWISPEGMAILQITGKSGSGKSVLCASLLEHLSLESNLDRHTLCWSFHEDSAQGDPAKDLLTSLTQQLFYLLIAENPRDIQMLLQRLPCDDMALTEESFSQCLNSLLSGPWARNPIYVIVDGLKCEDWLHKSLQHTINFLNTSRRLHLRHKCAMFLRIPASRCHTEQSESLTIDLDKEAGAQRDFDAFISAAQMKKGRLNTSPMSGNLGSFLLEAALEGCLAGRFLFSALVAIF